MSESKSLGREAFFNGLQLQRRTVEVPELGGTVVIRELSSREMYAVQAKLWRGKGRDRYSDSTNLREYLIVAAAETADGLPLFKDEDVPQLSRLPFRVLERLVDVLNDLNGVNADPDEVEAELQADPFDSPSID